MHIFFLAREVALTVTLTLQIRRRISKNRSELYEWISPVRKELFDMEHDFHFFLLLHAWFTRSCAIPMFISKFLLLQHTSNS